MKKRLYLLSLCACCALLLGALLTNTSAVTTEPTADAELVGHWLFTEESGDLIVDYSGNAYDALILAPDHIWRTGEGPGGGALCFDGNPALDTPAMGGHVVATGIATQLTEPTFTFSAWIRPASLEEWALVMSKMSNSLSWGDGFCIYASGGGIMASIAQSVSVWSGSIALDAWTHIAFVCDGVSTMTLYINGFPAATAATSQNALNLFANNAPLSIGSISDGYDTWPWHGEIADVRAYDGSLTDSEIFDMFTEAPESESVDTDADGMPDLWELQYGLNPRDPADAALDLDNDGFTNLQEYRLGMNPTKAAVTSPTPLLRVLTPME